MAHGIATFQLVTTGLESMAAFVAGATSLLSLALDSLPTKFEGMHRKACYLVRDGLLEAHMCSITSNSNQTNF